MLQDIGHSYICIHTYHHPTENSNFYRTSLLTAPNQSTFGLGQTVFKTSFDPDFLILEFFRDIENTAFLIEVPNSYFSQNFSRCFSAPGIFRIVVLQPTVAFCAVCGELHIHSKESAYLLSRVLIHLGGNCTVTVRGEP